MHLLPTIKQQRHFSLKTLVFVFSGKPGNEQQWVCVSSLSLSGRSLLETWVGGWVVAESECQTPCMGQPPSTKAEHQVSLISGTVLLRTWPPFGFLKTPVDNLSFPPLKLSDTFFFLAPSLCFARAVPLSGIGFPLAHLSNSSPHFQGQIQGLF